MPPHKSRTEINDTPRVSFPESESSGTVLAMTEQITLMVRDDANIADVVRQVIADGYTELVDHHYDVTADCDVLVYART